MKYFFLIWLFLFFGCNSNLREAKDKDNEKKQNQCFIYPRLIDSLHVRDLYDSARWFIYTWHCDMPYIPKAGSTKTKAFGELELRFNSVVCDSNSVAIDFDFIDDGIPVLIGEVLGSKGIESGVKFNYKSRKKIAMLSHSGYSIAITGNTSRYENPMQPEVISYIKNNWSRLDDCFRELAVQKGIMK